MSQHVVAQHRSHRANYLAVFIALCVFTTISVVTDVIHIPSRAVLAVIVLAVAVAKALCVMAYFMHLKFERNWKYVLLAPTIILATGIPLALLPDVGVHYYAVSAPQHQELRHAVQTVVDQEDKSAPLSDEDIARRIKSEYHYDLTADTVSRFRHLLNIAPPAKRQIPRQAP